MIYDILAHIQRYEGLQAGVVRGLKYLAETDFSQLPDGRQEIDGDEVFANIMTYTPNPDNPTPEGHRAYIDIQYLIQGQELVGVAPLEEMTGVAEARPEQDCWLYHGPATRVPIGQGRFLVLWPGDAHAPGIAMEGQSGPVRKCVVKVRVR